MGEKRRGGIYNTANWKEFLDAAQNRCNEKEKSKEYRKDLRKFMRKYAEEHKLELNMNNRYYTDAKSEVFNEAYNKLWDSKKWEQYYLM